MNERQSYFRCNKNIAKSDNLQVSITKTPSHHTQKDPQNTQRNPTLISLIVKTTSVKSIHVLCIKNQQLGTTIETEHY